MKNILFGARTYFSLGQSILSPKTVVREAKAAGYDGVAIADVHSLNAMVDVFKESKDVGIDVHIGTTVRVVDDITFRKAKRGEPKKAPNPFFMPSLYVKNDAGLKDLNELLSLAQDEDHFYFVPQIDKSELIATLSKGNLILTTGNAFSLFSHRKHGDLLDELVAAGNKSIRVEITPVGNPYFDRVSEVAYQAASKYGIEVIYSRPVWYEEGQVSFRNTLDCILNRAKTTEMWRNEPNDSLHTFSPADLELEVFALHKRLGGYGIEVPVVRTDVSRFSAECSYKWHSMDISLPDMAEQPFMELVSQAKVGWSDRINKPVLGYQPDPALIGQYKARLKHELTVIRNLGFENYFLVVGEVVDWCKKAGIAVGPGRGSAAGSLLSFLLGITDVDPIRFGLIFERFLNPDRLDWPDIDLDFQSSRRQEAIDHLVDKYGEDRVAGISNYGMLQGKSALRQVASAHGLSEFEFACSKQIGDEGLEESVDIPDVRRFADKHPVIWAEAVALQGAYRSAGKHAAGIVVAGEPITNRAVIEKRKDGLVTNWDKRVVEDMGLIKLDILGLSTLDLLSKAVEYIHRKTGETVNYIDLPLDDKPTLESFTKGETLGVFQFEGGNARRMLKEAGAEGILTFEEVSAVTALNRPGPLESGIAEEWMKVRKGFKPMEYLTPELEPFLKDTYGQVVYQEQVMQVAQVLCGFSMSEADFLRKAMGKKVPEEMAKYKEQFVDGSKDKIGESAAVALWENLEKFAGYAFNRAHSASYALLSYFSMWVKTHHADCFYAAALTILKEEKLAAIVREAETKNIYVVPPDINRSTDQFEIGYDPDKKQTVLFAPFQSIKGLSVKAADAILQAKTDMGRDFTSKAEFVSVVNRRACNIRGQDSLDRVGAFASIETDQVSARDESRLRDQKLLLPGIISLDVKADRTIRLTKDEKTELAGVIADALQAGETELGETGAPTPRLGTNAEFMIVAEFPSWSECEAGKYGEGKGCSAVRSSMATAGLTYADAYTTALVKCKKPKDKDIDLVPYINCYSDHLMKEIAVIKPPVVITLGSKALRKLVPEAKGGWEELTGSTHYLPELDCTVVAGINPGMLYFDPSRQKLLDAAFQKVKEITKK